MSRHSGWKHSASRTRTALTTDDIGRWFDTAPRHRSPLWRVMATQHAPSTFEQDDLLTCAAALEAFDRTETGHVRGRHTSSPSGPRPLRDSLVDRFRLLF